MFSVFLEEQVWTTVTNNMSPQTSVTSVGQEGKAGLQITYNLTDEQVKKSHTHTELNKGSIVEQFIEVRVKFNSIQNCSVFLYIALVLIVIH